MFYFEHYINISDTMKAHSSIMIIDKKCTDIILQIYKTNQILTEIML